MDSEVVQARLGHLEPLVIKQSNGLVRIFDRSARVACDVSQHSLNCEDTLLQLESWLETSATFGAEPQVWISIDVVSESLRNNDVVAAIIALCDVFEPRLGVNIRVHFKASPDSWELSLSQLQFVRDNVSRPRSVEIEAIGPFRTATESEMEAMMDAGVRIRFSAGWTHGYDAANCLKVDTEALTAFSQFGFRTAILWFVHAYNISEFENTISQLLIDTYQSGFGLPLASASPFYRFDPLSPPLPTSEAYCQLLVRSYKSYPHFDEILSPLIDLAILIRDGGWHSQWNIPSAIHFSLDSHGNVGLFRQAPSLALPFGSASNIIHMSRDVLQKTILEFIAREFIWEKNAYCHPCRWKHVCGGLDNFANNSLGTNDLETMCSYRKLFLKHFGAMRSADYLVGTIDS